MQNLTKDYQSINSTHIKEYDYFTDIDGMYARLQIFKNRETEMKIIVVLLNGKPIIIRKEAWIMELEDMLADIAKSNADEQDAIEGYFKLLRTIDYTMVGANESAFYEMISDIKEIISDEMNHTEKLSKWMTYFSGIEAANDWFINAYNIS